MCGIAGTFGFGDSEMLKAMTDIIAHRGPDGEYFYHDGPVHLHNQHTRLNTFTCSLRVRLNPCYNDSSQAFVAVTLRQIIS